MRFREYVLSLTALLVLVLTLPLAVVVSYVTSYAHQVIDECEAAIKAREESA